jgi:hypothetical protein
MFFRFHYLLFLALCTNALFGQAGRTLHGTCINPVPAVDITNQPFVNNWKDTYSDTWTLTSTNGSISGKVTVLNTGCPT